MPFNEVIEELTKTDLEYIRKIGLFMIECRRARKSGQFVGHINGNGFLAKVDLKREEEVKL